MISYLHLNPIKLIDPKWQEDGIKDRKKAEGYLDGYRYSSYLDYLGSDRIEKAILNKDALPKYFKNSTEFKTIVTEWLNGQGRTLPKI